MEGAQLPAARLLDTKTLSVLMYKLYLPHHVHFCQRGEVYVFLDLQKDDYVLVNGTAAGCLRGILSGTDTTCSRPDSINSPLGELLNIGLLTRDPCDGRTLQTTRINVAMEGLLDLDDVRNAHISSNYVACFAMSCLSAAARFRSSGLESAISRMRRRKARLSTTQPVDFARARELTATFKRLRTLFPRDYLCLFDSFALIEFLANYQIFPTCVFGVRLEPWAAHCWVQEGVFVFNEDVEEAASYTPIMAI